jgi:hypothetical protein
VFVIGDLALILKVDCTPLAAFKTCGIAEKTASSRYGLGRGRASFSNPLLVKFWCRRVFKEISIA